MDIPIGTLLYVALFVVVGVWCVLAVVKPRVAWELNLLSRVWQYKKAPTPSEAALFWTRVTGVVLLVLFLLAGVLRVLDLLMR